MTLQTQAKSAQQAPPAGSATQATQAPTTGTPQAPQTGQPVIQTGPGRSETPQQLRDRIRADVQNAIRNGRDQQINFPDRVDFRNAVPEGAVIISVAFFVSIAATIIFAPLARAVARRVDRQSEAALKGATDLSPRLTQLQDSVDTMAMEVERISEAQRFQSKLLAERVKEPIGR